MFDFVEYSTGSEYSIKNRVYHILTQIKVFWSGHKGLDYDQYLLNLFSKKNPKTVTILLVRETNFTVVEYSTGTEYSIKKDFYC